MQWRSSSELQRANLVPICAAATAAATSSSASSAADFRLSPIDTAGYIEF